MARYIGTVEAPHSAEEVWHYLADLRSAGEWDPSVERVELTAGEPGAEGASYDLEVRFRGRTIPLSYRTVTVDPPHRVVFEAATDSVVVRDEARVDRIGETTSRVTWDADLRLRGLRRVLDLPLRALFNQLGEDAKKGLGERLAGPTLGGSVVRIEK
jgi:hypothetical protein